MMWYILCGWFIGLSLQSVGRSNTDIAYTFLYAVLAILFLVLASTP